MKSRTFALNVLLRFGLASLAVGVLALVLLVVQGGGLEDTLPLVLFLIAFLCIPAGLLLCVIGAVINYLRRRSAQV